MSKRLRIRNSGADKKLKKLLDKAKAMAKEMPPKKFERMIAGQAKSWSRQDKD